MDPIRAGTILVGRYELDSVLGRGGFGEVWRATDLRLAPRAVALKFLRQAKPSTELMRRFALEARALASLNHPNIVSILDQGNDGSNPFLVMEFLSGETLDAWLDDYRRRGAWPDFEQVLDIFDQIAAAIEAAHAITSPGPIIHRDLKPGNVLLVKGKRSSDLHAKVLDFGLAQLGGRGHTPSGAVFGTPAYMAPEQALGRASSICPATDVFSLAVTLIEMLTLEMESADKAPWWHEVVRSSPQGAVLDHLRPNLPSQIWNQIARALDKSPENRHEDAGRFRSAIREARRRIGPLAVPSVALGRIDRLRILEEQVYRCKRCSLSESRTQPAFGRGAVPAEVMFFGEAPGAVEDASGVAFSGPAGQLLDRMIAAMSLTPDQVYLSNVIKCRPPGNRLPQPNELASCQSHWTDQVKLVQPKILVTLGKVASQTVLNTTSAISRLRGRWHMYAGLPTMPTYHPAFLLRRPAAKKDAWGDLKRVRDRLGLLVR